MEEKFSREIEILKEKQPNGNVGNEKLNKPNIKCNGKHHQ
jgi:hypothetical protein